MPYPNPIDSLWNHKIQNAFPSLGNLPFQTTVNGNETPFIDPPKEICLASTLSTLGGYNPNETSGFDITDDYCLNPPRHLLIIGDTDGLEREKAVESILGYMRAQHGIFANDDFLVRRIKRRQQLSDLLDSIPESSLASVAYFGHGTRRFLPLDLSYSSRNSLLSAEDLLALNGKLFDHAPIRLFGCNTNLLAQRLAKELDTDVWGNNGSTKGLANVCGYYLPVAPAVEHYLRGGFRGKTLFYPGALLQSYHDIRH